MATSITVFRIDGSQKKFVGAIPKDGTALSQLSSVVQEAQTVEESGGFRPRFELTVLGVGFYWLLQYDSDARLLEGHNLTDRRLERRGTVRLARKIEDILMTAAPPTKSVMRFKPARQGNAQWMSLPRDLIELVERSPLILIGTPVGVVRNDWLVPDDPFWQAIVYAVVVGRYLKDDTGLYLPLIKHHQGGGYLGGGFAMMGNPLLEIGQRYFMFLRPASGRLAQTDRGPARDAYPDEYVAVHPFTRTPIVDEWTVPAELDPNFVPAYLFPDKKTTLILKKEEQVIGEIRAAIKQSQRK